MAKEFELKYDCLTEILCRLPVKSLIRFTCVCKAWLSVIRSPDFITKHHDHHQNSNHQLVLSHYTCGSSFSLFSSDQNRNLTFQTAFKFRPAVAYDPPQYQIYHRDVVQDCWIIGPCNGLFFISLVKGFTHAYRVFLLWNPATREVFKLADNNLFDCWFHGFGFDAVNNDYKVVGLYASTDDGIDSSIVCLYSLATDSWTRLYHAYDNVPTVPHYTRVCFRERCSSNGRMHNWISYDYDPTLEMDRLLSFDMVDEVFVQTPLPLHDDHATIPIGFLSHGSKYPYVYDFTAIGDAKHLLIWVLQDYGPTGFWNKLLDITMPEYPSPTFYAALWNDNQFVFSPFGTMPTLTSFDLTTKQMTSLGVPADADVIAYTESLVPIAKSVRQQPPPNIHHSHCLDDQQQHFQFQQDDNENDDSDDSSSVDSAFLIPDTTPFNDCSTTYDETDTKYFPRRKNEVDRLSNLPYCLREINHPMLSNPCTF